VDVASTTNSLVAADVAACSNNTSAQILSGYVRFANGNPTVDEAESPAGGTLNLDIDLTLTTVHPSPPVCFDDATDDPAVAAAMHEVTYYCLIYTNGAGTWAGRSRISPRAFSALPVWTIAAAGAANYKVCRYTPLAVDVGGRNIDHPLDYTAAGSPARGGLTNQNFLVIAANFTCPVESPVVGFFNSNTLLHQDGSVTYNTP
jgi:hypothetical protein